MKKSDVPKGKNVLTLCIEKIMTDYGGEKYAKISKDEFLVDVDKRLMETHKEAEGPIKPFIVSLRKKLRRMKDVPEMLFALNEALFIFFESED